MNVYLGLSPLGLGLQHRPHHNISAACHRHVRWRFALCILHLATYIHIGMTPPSDQRMNACIVFSPLGFGLLHRSRSINKIYQRRTTAARAFALRIVYSATHIHIGMVPSSDQRMNFLHWRFTIGFWTTTSPPWRFTAACRRSRARAGASHRVFSVVYPHLYDPVFRPENDFVHWVSTNGFSTAPRSHIITYKTCQRRATAARARVCPSHCALTVAYPISTLV